METLKLRIPGNDPDELLLGAGMHAIGRNPARAQAIGLVADGDTAFVRFCVDRRGIWLMVGDGVLGVHVNGRPVQRMAMLRVGDAVFVDGAQIVLTTARTPEQPLQALRNAPSDGDGDVRTVLRGLGGQHHGRSFTLERPLLIGRAVDADIRIDDPSFADRHARVESHGDTVVLRDLDSASGSLLNGMPVRDALLQAGDQLVFDPHHRFVLEAPRGAHAEPAASSDPAGSGAPVDARKALQNSARRLPWLLLAALLIAGAMSALLLFGSTT
ncbi:MAG TPA: FHA domain-containing protein [Luteimonas sp.]|nr:FHA domain-containing protein [Luteimonas sp.]